MFYNTVTTDLKPIDYFHRLVKLYCDKESNRVQYLLCCLNALIMVATVNLLRFGRTLSPASAIVMPWTMTWSMTVARISSVMMVRGCLALPPGPSPLPCWPPPLPCWPPPLPCWPPPLPCWPPLSLVGLPLSLVGLLLFFHGQLFSLLWLEFLFPWLCLHPLCLFGIFSKLCTLNLLLNMWSQH